jgi:hypothetical protein
LHVHLEEIDSGSENDGEGAGPDGKIDVFLVEESFGTLLIEEKGLEILSFEKNVNLRVRKDRV